MPLNATVLKGEIKTALLGIEGVVDDATMDAVWEAVASAVVAHITANAVVNVPAGVAVLCAPYAGSTTAPGIGTIS